MISLKLTKSHSLTSTLLLYVVHIISIFVTYQLLGIFLFIFHSHNKHLGNAFSITGAVRWWEFKLRLSTIIILKELMVKWMDRDWRNIHQGTVATVYSGTSLGLMAVGGTLREGVRRSCCFTSCSCPHPLQFFSPLSLSCTGRLNSSRFPNKFTASAFTSKCTMPTVYLKN